MQLQATCANGYVFICIISKQGLVTCTVSSSGYRGSRAWAHPHIHLAIAIYSCNNSLTHMHAHGSLELNQREQKSESCSSTLLSHHANYAAHFRIWLAKLLLAL